MTKARAGHFVEGHGSTGLPAKSKAAPESGMDLLIGSILRIGVITSFVLIAAGIAWRWLRTGTLGMDYSIRGLNFFEFVIEDLKQIFRGDYRPRLLVNLGIAVLMLTPLIRVSAAAVYFAVEERNWKYALFTGLVFAVLTYSLFLR